MQQSNPPTGPSPSSTPAQPTAPPAGGQPNPWSQYPYTAGGLGSVGALSNGAARFISATSELSEAETGTEFLAGSFELGGALIEGAAVGGAVGLGVGAVVGVLVAGGIYIYEKYH